MSKDSKSQQEKIDALLTKPHPKHPEDYEIFIYSKDLKLTRDKHNGMYHATGIAKQLGDESKVKHIDRFFKSENFMEMIEGFCKEGGYERDQLYVKTQTGPRDMKGYWIHELLVEQLAMWCSPSYTYKVMLLLKKIREQEREQLAKELKEWEVEFDDLYKEKEELRKDVDVLVKDLNEKDDDIEYLKDDCKRIEFIGKEKLEEKDIQIMKLMEKVADLEDENAKLEERIQIISARIDSIKNGVERITKIKLKTIAEACHSSDSIFTDSSDSLSWCDYCSESEESED